MVDFFSLCKHRSQVGCAMDRTQVASHAASKNRCALILNNPLITDCQRLRSTMETLMAVMAYQSVLFTQRYSRALSGNGACFRRIVDFSMLDVGVTALPCWRNFR